MGLSYKDAGVLMETMSDRIKELERQIVQLKSKSNQRKRTLHNHKNKLSQARKIISEAINIIDESLYDVIDLDNFNQWKEKAKLILRTQKDARK